MKREQRFQMIMLVWAAVGLLGLGMIIFSLKAERPVSPAEQPQAMPSAAAQTVSAPLAPEETPAAPETVFMISELMSHNRTGLRTADGRFPDWIELQNVSGHRASLDGWSLERDGKRFALPAQTLPDGGVLLLIAGEASTEDGLPGTGFTLRDGDALKLRGPDGEVRDGIVLPALPADESLALREDGERRACRTPTPGAANTPESYDLLQAQTAAPDGLCLNEWSACGVTADWVELRNNGGTALDLAAFSLSDSLAEPQKYRLPALTLEPGGTALFSCEKELPGAAGVLPFSLKAGEEGLYLFAGDGLVDAQPLRAIGGRRSMGRLPGGSGIFFFDEPSPGAENPASGRRRLSEMPEAAGPDGVFEDVESVTVELRGEGSIHYTTDGSLPTEDSPLYSEPLTLTESAAIRAVQITDGALPSDALTLNYLINEGHTLPVLCLNTDEPSLFWWLYTDGNNGQEIAGDAALYASEGSFHQGCSLRMAGRSTLSTMRKKSLKLGFSSAWGEGKLHGDLFGAEESFSTLNVRAGNDAAIAVLRNELWQALAEEAQARVLTQRSRFAVVYINGSYRGIYSLKEDYSRSYYAQRRGVSAESVESEKTPLPADSLVREELCGYFENLDLSDSAVYEELCRRLDIDSLIDWVLLQGISGNTDVYANMRFFRSPECGGCWELAYFDLDFAMEDMTDPFRTVYGRSDAGAHPLVGMLWRLRDNPDFVDRLVRRYLELSRGALSSASILAKLDEMTALLEPEIVRNYEQMGITLDQYDHTVRRMRSLLEGNWEQICLSSLAGYLNLSTEEILSWDVTR